MESTSYAKIEEANPLVAKKAPTEEVHRNTSGMYKVLLVVAVVAVSALGYSAGSFAHTGSQLQTTDLHAANSPIAPPMDLLDEGDEGEDAYGVDQEDEDEDEDDEDEDEDDEDEDDEDEDDEDEDEDAYGIDPEDEDEDAEDDEDDEDEDEEPYGWGRRPIGPKRITRSERRKSSKETDNAAKKAKKTFKKAKKKVKALSLWGKKSKSPYEKRIEADKRRKAREKAAERARIRSLQVKCEKAVKDAKKATKHPFRNKFSHLRRQISRNRD